MRLSLVLLSFIVPALFSSLLNVSALAEGENAQRNINNSIASVEASSFLASDWEQDTPDAYDDETDNDTLAWYVFPTWGSCNSSDSLLLVAISQLTSLTNSIRGPPTFS